MNMGRTAASEQRDHSTSKPSQYIASGIALQMIFFGLIIAAAFQFFGLVNSLNQIEDLRQAGLPRLADWAQARLVIGFLITGLAMVVVYNLRESLDD